MLERENSVTSERMVAEALAMRFCLTGYTALYRRSSKVLTNNFRRLGRSTYSGGSRKKAYAAVNDIDISCIK